MPFCLPLSLPVAPPHNSHRLFPHSYAEQQLVTMFDYMAQWWVVGFWAWRGESLRF